MYSINENSEYSFHNKHLLDFCRTIGVGCFSTEDFFGNSVGLRFLSPWPLFKQISKNYEIDTIKSAKRRHNIRWALRKCTVEPVTFELQLFLTIYGQKRSNPLIIS